MLEWHIKTVRFFLSVVDICNHRYRTLLLLQNNYLKKTQTKQNTDKNGRLQVIQVLGFQQEFSGVGYGPKKQ